MADYLRRLRVEAKKRWDAKMTAGRAATEEYNAIKATKKTAGFDRYEEPYDEHV
jgi:phage-related minor tail protein